MFFTWMMNGCKKFMAGYLNEIIGVVLSGTFIFILRRASFVTMLEIDKNHRIGLEIFSTNYFSKYNAGI